jgi:hypothetical protein
MAAAEEEDLRFCQTCGAQLFPESSYCHQCGMKVEPKKKVEISPVKQDLNDFADFQLVQVYSVVNDFRYREIRYDNLKINWFVADRAESPVPFEHSIAGYKELSLTNRIGPENYIKQRFTLEEAKLLKHYLFTSQNVQVFFEGCPLPVNSNSRGYRDVPPPPGTGFVLLHQKSNYQLSFKVEGVFDTRIADERILGDDDRITVVSGINIKDLKKYLKEKEAQGKSDSSS